VASSKHWAFLLGFGLVASLMTGCTEPPQAKVQAASDARMEFFVSCNAFQQIVWSLDSNLQETLKVLDAEKRNVSAPENYDEFDTMPSFIDILRASILEASGEMTLQQFLVRQPKEIFDADKAWHEAITGWCSAVGFTIVDNSFLTASWEGGALGLPEHTDPSQQPLDSAEKCTESMRLASLEKNSTVAEKYLKETAEHCGGKSEWYAALEKYPYAMGFPDVAGNELDILCYQYPNTSACRNP